MSWFAWILSVLIVVLALLYVSPRLRKTAFIWFTYISLTGWYYFRLWEKKRARTSAGAASPTAKAGKAGKASSTASSSSSGNSVSSSSATTRASTTVTQRHSARHTPLQDEDDIEDVVYFESAENLQQRELRSTAEQSRRRLSGSSSSGNSGYSDDSLGKLQAGRASQRPPKSHLGIFRSLRKSAREDAKGRHSEPSDPLASSTVSEPGMTTRRTYTGRRKKPQSWAD